MTSDGESGKGRGGFFASLGRLFGVGGRSEGAAESAAEDGPGAPEGQAGDGGAAGPPPGPARDVADDAKDEDGGDELILGPELQAAPDDSGDDEDELTLIGESAAHVSGRGGAAEDAVEAEEEAIMAELRSSLQAQSKQADGPGEPAITRSEDEWAGSFEQVEAVPTPEEESKSGLAADFGGARDEGGLAEGDHGPEGPEYMEAGDMGRKNKSKPGDDAVTQEGESEAQAGAVPLFPRARAPDPDATGDEEAASGGTDEERVAARDADADDEPGTEEPAAERADAAEAEAEEPETAKVEAGESDTAEAESAEPDAAETGAEDLETAEAGDPETGEAAAKESRTEDAEAGEAGEGEPVSAGEVLALAAAAESGGSPAAEEASDEPGAERADGDIEETVRRLIREELAGELGERLSANIRRMIREEVTHALLRQR